MNEFCLEFMKQAVDQTVVGPRIKDEFVASLYDCNRHGYYLAFSKTKGWVLSNKNPERLAKQIETFDSLVNSLFEVV